MHSPSRRTVAASLLATGLYLVACSGGGGTTAVLTPLASEPRIESERTAGDADAFAGELWIAAGRTPATPLRPSAPVADPVLRDALGAVAQEHLRSVAYGAGTGPAAEGTQRVVRLAAAATAPPDGNGNGTNRDEALAADVARLAALTGAIVPAGLRQTIVPWAEGRADLATPPTAAGAVSPDQWRTTPPPGRTVRVIDIAAAMHGRVRALGDLLGQRRGALFGASADTGLLGLVLLSQVVGAEEELVKALSTDGSLLGGFADPHAYDPAQGRRWLATEVEALEAPDGTLSWRPRDLASDLATLAATIDAAAELAWFSGPANPSASVQAVFAGPFAPPPPQNPPQPRLNWQQHILPILTANCSFCHFGFPTGGFRCDTYALTLAGSPRINTLGHTMVIPGNSAQSMLLRILTSPPPPIPRMPPVPSPQVSLQNRQTIATWIDQGALENPEVVPPPPRPGEDLAALSYRNLVAMHLDRSSGALVHRHEGDAASTIATAAATGRALSALAHLRTALPDLDYDGLEVAQALSLAAGFAAAHFVAPDGRVFEQVELADLLPSRPAGLAEQAVLTAGLLDAARSLALPAVQSAATAAATALLTSFRDPVQPWFRSVPEHAFARYSPRLLADLLAALRLAVAAGIPGATAAHEQLLARLLPTLAYASWSGDFGLPVPAAAGGGNGRLPVIAGAILVGPAADAPPADAPLTWSQHIRPLLLQKCGACHFGGAAQGGYRADTLQRLGTPGGLNGPLPLPLVAPGSAEGSFLYRKLVDRVPAVGAQMPLQSTMLDDRGRAMVRQWIDAGATGR